MTTAFFFLFFCIVAIVLVSTALGFNFLESQRKKQVKSMLRTVDGNPPEQAATSILFDAKDKEDLMGRTVSQLAWAQALETILQQSGLNWSIERLVGLTLGGAAIGLILGWKFNPLVFPLLSLLAMAVAGASLPYHFVRYKRRKRFAEFEEQFPEALDFLARSMRAGHAFSISLEMIGEESPNPLGIEFRTMFNEQNLGAPMEAALANLERRVPLVDVRFFISSIMLQKQTGGNLSEILTRLAYVIRERFKLRGQVKAASAHGRMTATILTLMPLVLMVGLLFMAPGYLEGLAKEKDGKWLVVAAIISQCLGYYFIRRIIRIKV
jgi:tight adherence protein B